MSDLPSQWFRYVHDILVVMPEGTNVYNNLPMLNEVNEHNSTIHDGMEADEKLIFLDTDSPRGQQQS